MANIAANPGQDRAKARAAAKLLRALQWTDVDIGLALGVSPWTAGRWRKRAEAKAPDVPPHQLAILGARRREPA